MANVKDTAKFRIAALLGPIACSLSLFGCGEPLGSVDDDDDAATTAADASTGTGGATSAGDASSGPDSGSTSTTSDPDTSDASSGAESGSEGGSSSDSGSDTGPPSCGAGQVCVSAVPAGWDGPAALQTVASDDEIPPCGGGDYVDLQFSDGMSGLTADDASCSCSCDDSALSCEGVADLQLTPEGEVGGFSPCTFPNWVYDETIPSDSPQAVSYDLDGPRGVLLDMVTSTLAGECNPQSTEEVAAAAFSRRTIACGTFDADAPCGDDGVCVPEPNAPYEGGVCIWQDGDHECPADLGYTERTTLYQSISDTRSCTTCECGDASGSCTDPQLVFSGECLPFGQCNVLGGCPCEDEPTLSAEVLNTCQFIRDTDFYEECTGPICVVGPEVNLTGITYDAGTPDASCAPTGGDPTGQAVGAEPITVCCTPE